MNPNLSGGLLEVVNTTQPENGSCELSSDSHVRYTPTLGFIGTDQCSYFVCIESTVACAKATVTIDVVEVKIAEDDEVDTSMNTPVSVDVLENDEYAEDPDELLVITDITSQPENGACEVLENILVYTPNKNFSGTDQCKYVVCAEDSAAACDVGTLTIYVVSATPTVGPSPSPTVKAVTKVPTALPTEHSTVKPVADLPTSQPAPQPSGKPSVAVTSPTYKPTKRNMRPFAVGQLTCVLLLAGIHLAQVVL